MVHSNVGFLFGMLREVTLFLFTRICFMSLFDVNIAIVLGRYDVSFTLASTRFVTQAGVSTIFI